MITFNFTRTDDSYLATEFDHGDISLISENACISSKLNPKHSNMIYLSITSLIDGLTKNNKNFEFIAADSSFRIKFKKQKDAVSIIHGRSLSFKVKYLELLIALEEGIESFLENPKNSIPASSAVYLDLLTSRSLLRKKIHKPD
ncbi:hypothetical protein [Pseudomonas putida]|uniref:hypothetical protein n=1 Tax=Pseudomonas putida TaxID=303 RepID=UPI0012ACFC3B|nr:hypothetical protein [Pseudomonas putida]